jgi:DNA-binding transcriptional LysR family regulator
MEDRLRKFAAVCDAGSFTKAAGELHISQPALSAAIRILERELGAPLLVHGVRPLTITPAGHVAYESAKSLAVTTQNLQVKLAELTQSTVQLRIGMIDSVADSLFSQPNVLQDISSSAQLSIMVNNSRTLVAAAVRNELDIAFVATPPTTPDSTLSVQHLADEPLVLVCNQTQATLYNAALRRGALPRLISYDQASNTYRLLAEALHRQGLQPHIAVYSTSPEVMVRLVQLEQGAAILPYHLVAPHVTSGIFYLLNVPGVLLRGISVAHRRDKTIASDLAQLTQRVRHSLCRSLAEAEASLSA